MLSRRNLIRSLPAAAAAFCSCSDPPPVSRRYRAPRHPLKVVTTTTFAADLARGVGQEGVEVNCLIPHGVNPHLWKPTAPDVAAMRLADVVLFHGLGLEQELPETPETLEKFGVRAVYLTDAIPPENLISTGPDAPPDPHVWMNPLLWTHCADHACQAMAEAMPRSREYFETGAHEYKVSLRRLHERAASRLRSSGGPRRVLTSHDTLRYFAAAFGLDVRSLASARGEFPESAPQDLLDWVSGNRVSWLFYEHGSDLLQLRELFSLTLIQEHQQIFSLSLAPPNTLLTATAEPLRTDTYLDAIQWNVDVIARGAAA